ncbi:cold-shock protein [Anatilimnocola floriformis]|uniref:cold-shock protein n=1 Tax=Anatilimnocola floriformis TaxID=2948575 RepID=UPI0020C222D9|nr:cold shock domain-containing protein [Anatilimnocola floriformis]
MNYGVIYHVVFEKGFGFIKPDRGQDIFFPAVAVQDGRFDHIGPEQPVKYELEMMSDEEKKKAKGPRAKIVILIDKIPGGILEDTPAELRAKHHPNKRGRKATWKRKIELNKPPESEKPAAEAELESQTIAEPEATPDSDTPTS